MFFASVCCDKCLILRQTRTYPSKSVASNTKNPRKPFDFRGFYYSNLGNDSLQFSELELNY